MRHFLTTRDLTPEQFEKLLARAEEFRGGARSAALADAHVGLVFFNPSLRTRVSMEVAVSKLGGVPVTLSVGSDAWMMEYRDGVVMDGPAAEHAREGAGVLGRYCDLLGVRSFPEGKDYAQDRREPVLNAFAKYSGVPVVNLESPLDHPCQAMADALTIRQRLGTTAGRRVLLTWAYHPKALPMAVPNSFLLGAARLAPDLVFARPKGYELDPEIVQTAQRLARESGGTLTETSDLDAAYEGAEVVYAKSWGALADYGAPEAELARRSKLKDWRVTESRMARGKNAIFLHCLPVRRNVVVDDEVLDGPRSAVLDQAENRMYAQQAILEWLAEER
ncbi:MAG: N-acetylornithine carbamoyltransferase [Acidobacteriota bacterium]|nr:N-acetylornithine carbamoyltransferase [Acidobacteriota bacterium]